MNTLTDVYDFDLQNGGKVIQAYTYAIAWSPISPPARQLQGSYQGLVAVAVRGS